MKVFGWFRRTPLKRRYDDATEAARDKSRAGMPLDKLELQLVLDSFRRDRARDRARGPS